MNSLGGRSKHLGSALELGKIMRAVQGLGLPGSSSHWNGTDAGVCSGGVSVPECLGEPVAGNCRIFGVKLGFSSPFDPIIFFLFVFGGKWESCVNFDDVFSFYRPRRGEE